MRLILALLLIALATPAAADPATMVIAALTASGVTVSAGAAIAIRIGVGLAFSALANAMQSSANANRAPQGIAIRSMTAGEQVPQSLIFGRYVTAGNLVAPEMTHGVDGDTRYLTRVVDLCDMRIEGVESLIIDGVACELATGSPATLTMTDGDGTTDAISNAYGPTVNKGDFIGFAWCKWYDGTQNAATGTLLNKYGSAPQRPWTADMIGTGVAYAMMTFLWRDSPQVWQGRPDVRFVVKGIRLYDPRLDSTAGGSGAHRYATQSTHQWTENPVVMIYNLLRGIVLPGGDIFGGGCAASELPYATWAAAMNACDVMIGDRKTYIAGLEVFMGGGDVGGSSPADVIEELLRACSGQIADVGGEIYIRVGAPGLPVKFITDDDVLVSQSQELDSFPGAEDSYNVVHATWMSPGNLWQAHEATPRRDEAAITADGQELVANIALPAVTVPQQVQQLMVAWLKDAQRHRRQSITLPPDGILVKPLDVIDWTSARNGYIGKDFEVGQVAIDPTTLCTTLAMREVDPDDYDWGVGDDIAFTAPSIEPEVVGPVTVPGFTATSTTIKDGTGSDRLPAVRLGWNTPLPGVSALRFQIRVNSTNTVAVEGSTANVDVGYHIVSAGIVGNVQYQARARLVGPPKTEWSPWVTVTAPDVGITASDFQGSIEQVFQDAGLAAVEIVASLPVTGNFVGRTVYLTTDHKLYRWNGTEWTAAVETVDLVGEIVAEQVADGAINTAKFATGIAPVEIVAALPATENFEGRTVYLTTDNKLYRHTGSPADASGFTASVPAVDVTGQLTDAQIADIAAAKMTGQITTTQIADNAISTPKISAGAVSASQIAAGAIVADKIATNAITAAKISADAVTADKIAANAVTTGSLAADSVTTAKVAAGAISTTELAANAVNASKIAAGAVTANELASNSVTAVKIAADAVTADKIAANAVTSNSIAANAITAGLIAAGAINTTALIVDGAVSRRVYARGSSITLTTGLQQVVSKTFGSGSFSAFQGTAGSRSNPILLNLDIQVTIYSGGSGWHKLRVTAGLNVSGTWQSDFLVQDFMVPLDAGFGLFQFTKAFVVDSGSWSTASAMRVRMNKNSTSVRIDADGDYMLTQISV